MKLTYGAIRSVTVALACSLFILGPAYSAQGEMGTGKPHWGQYSAATGIRTNVYALTDPTVGFPAGCSEISLSPATMGMDTYKIAYATLLFAKATGRAVRFYAHAVRDGGCGADYVQLVDQ